MKSILRVLFFLSVLGVAWADTRQASTVIANTSTLGNAALYYDMIHTQTGYAVWFASDPKTSSKVALANTYNTNTQTWGTAQQIGTSMDPFAQEINLSVDAFWNGTELTVLVAWYDAYAKQINCAYTTNHGRTWARDGFPMLTASSLSSDVQVAFSSVGYGYVIYNYHDGSNEYVGAIRSQNPATSSSWTPNFVASTAISKTSSHTFYPPIGGPNVQDTVSPYVAPLSLPPSRPAMPTHFDGVSKIDKMPLQKQFYVNLTWRPNITPEVIGYLVYRNGQFLGETVDHFFLDPAIEMGEMYTYSVFSYDNRGSRSPLKVTVTLE